jgi:hypothetical protein
MTRVESGDNNKNAIEKLNRLTLTIVCSNSEVRYGSS